MTRGDWAAQLLYVLGERIGVPTIQNSRNIQWIVDWQAGENTGAQFNPLATTWDMGSSDPNQTPWNSAGVQNYSSLQIGLIATVNTLVPKSVNPDFVNYYSDLLLALRNTDPDLTETWWLQQVQASPWGTFKAPNAVLTVGSDPNAIAGGGDWPS